jgi:RES domain-containing protein
VRRTAWRVEKVKYLDAVSTGEGARLVGGRWTSPGRPAVYCAEHLSLGILEVLVHAPDPTQRLVPRVRLRIHVAEALVERVADERIPADYSPRTPYSATRPIGDAWLDASRHPALSVPSAIVPTERTYVLNPRHPAFDRIVWDTPEALALDDRLWMIGA